MGQKMDEKSKKAAEKPDWKALLLKKGVDLDNPKDKEGALHLAVWKGQTDIVDLLLKAGADPNERQESCYDSTALYLAAWKGRLEMASLLLDAGANPDSRDSNNRTALHLAVLEGQTKIAKLLLDAGANPDWQDISHGSTALHFTVLCEAAERTELALLLLEYGADAEIKTRFRWKNFSIIGGSTAFAMAMLAGDEALARIFADWTEGFILKKWRKRQIEWNFGPPAPPE